MERVLLVVKRYDVGVDLPEEVWKDVVGFEDYYQISNQGRLRSKDCIRTNQLGIRRRWKAKLLKSDGHYGTTITLYGDEGKEEVYQIHRLVALHFIDNPDNLPFVCHRDDITSHNWESNLYWGTPQSNMIDARNNQRFRPHKGRWITNGEEDRKLDLGTSLPEGWKWGRSQGRFIRKIYTSDQRQASRDRVVQHWANLSQEQRILRGYAISKGKIRARILRSRGKP